MYTFLFCFYICFIALFLSLVLWKHLLNKPITSSTDGEPQPVKSTTAVKQSQPESKKFTAESEAESKISAAAVMESKREPERSSTDVKESLPEPERYTTPTKEPQTHVNPHWLPCGLGLGSLLYLTHMCFGEASLVSRWTVKSFPNTGPNPLMWG